MLQYMIILLDDTSTSFCHYPTPAREPRLISLDSLRTGIRLAMIENLTIQFVYPDRQLPQEHLDAIHSIDHSNIMPAGLTVPGEQADVTVLNGWDAAGVTQGGVAVVRTTMADLITHGETIIGFLRRLTRLNVVITDVYPFSDEAQTAYTDFLRTLADGVEQLYVEGLSPQLNLLTDRMMLSAMNNCGAGDSSITLAPNGRLYACPAFYHDKPEDSLGDVENGINIPNRQLYRLDHAPICRNCDAWHCRRCVWLNRRLTLEVNTPGREQCIMAHLERNASRRLLNQIRTHGSFLPEQPEIPEINYLDPFDTLQK